MARYLISFNDGDMNFPEKDLPDVAKAARAVVDEAKNAGVFVFSGGLGGGEPSKASVVSADGVVTEGPNAATKDSIGGFTIVDVRTREEALAWAARIAVSCRSAQEVRECRSAPTRRAALEAA